MSFGVLTDDRARYDRGLALFHSTVKGYFKWGRGHYSANRLIGESTETLRGVWVAGRNLLMSVSTSCPHFGHLQVLCRSLDGLLLVCA
jgi:hypothetical protein